MSFEGDVLYSGFLTKSPPEYKINRARWQRRWFVLKRTVSAVYLQYYKDAGSSRPKGTIDLNQCEQVDQGLRFESRRWLAKASIFGIVTPKRKYYLVSNTEDDMIRWVREICLACGFMLDGQDDEAYGNPSAPSHPVDVANSPDSRHGVFTEAHATSAPIPGAAESYIPLDECVTGEKDLSQSVPLRSSWADNGHQEHVSPMDLNPSQRDSLGSNSSIPAESAPLPPSSERDSAALDIYDIPPASGRPISGNVQPLYDIPPALLKREPSLTEKDDIYKPVPVPCHVDLNSSIPSSFPRNEYGQVNGDVHDPQDVGGLYDTPPAHALNRNHNKEMTASTDKLAQDFQQISFRNSMGASDDGSDLYSVPPSSIKNASDLLTSSSDGLQKNSTPPPRPPKLSPASAPSIENQSTCIATPPRPPKPQHLRPSTPPPSFDESYDVLPSHAKPIPPKDLIGKLQDIPVYSVPPGAVTNWNDLKSPPNGHQWLDSKVPTPSGSDRRYLNTRQSPSRQTMPATLISAMPASAGFLQQRVGPPTQALRSSMMDSNMRYTPAPTVQQESYLPMGGSSNSSNVFQYPDNSSYMAMQGSSEMSTVQEQRAPSDCQMYTLMSGGIHLDERPLPPNFHRKTFSGGERPPPIDRSLKPDRKVSDGALRTTDHFGMAGSFYANRDDIVLRPVHDMRPVQSDQTKSYSKRPSQYENQKLETDPDLFRTRSNTGDSTTSSSDDDIYSPGEMDFCFQPPAQAIADEDTYIYKDVPGTGLQSEWPVTEGLPLGSIPPSLPSQHKDSIEYLELSHDHDEEPRQSAPMRPPRPSSPKVQYIDLDLQRMQALKQVAESRDLEKDGGISGRGSLTRDGGLSGGKGNLTKKDL